MNSLSARTAQTATKDIAACFAGVELGGTKCVCTLALGPGAMVAQEIVPTTDPETTLSAIAAILDRWWRTHGFVALGIASFGPVSLNPAARDFGYILATNKPGWSMTDVGNRLAHPFPIPMGFDTDVNGAAMAEILWGSGQGLDDFAYITVGTGIGVGLVVHGRPTRGIGHSEMGHLRVPRLAGDSAPSGCRFHHDCVEGLASGTAVKAALGARHLSDIDVNDAIWNRVSAALTCLCHALVCTTGPLRIAMGGGVMTGQPHLIGRIATDLAASLNGYMKLPAGQYIVAPALGDQAGPMGSIALATIAARQHQAQGSAVF